MSMTAYAAQAIQNAFFGKTSAFGTLSNRPTIYVGLMDASGAEPSGGGYARVATTPSDWNEATAADPSVIKNAQPIDFGTATADWLSGANLVKFGFFDAATGGNKLFEAELTVPKPVLEDDPVSFPAGAIEVQLG